jgi:hypothetical protein
MLAANACLKSFLESKAGSLSVALPSAFKRCNGEKHSQSWVKNTTPNTTWSDMKVITPPTSIASVRGPKLFLAGSIEQDSAERWQDRLIEMLRNSPGTILNPRRENWDSTWKQSLANDQFYEQVQWELMGIQEADHIAFYFDPNTKSPITLMELGLCIGQLQNITVCCPEGFWRKGNVDIMCERYHIRQVSSLHDLGYEITKVLYNV